MMYDRLNLDNDVMDALQRMGEILAKPQLHDFELLLHAYECYGQRLRAAERAYIAVLEGARDDGRE